MKNILKGLFLGFLSSFFFFSFSSAVTPPLPGVQGGTGIGSATTSDIGKALIVSSTNPFQYKFGSIDAGNSLSTIITAVTPITVTTSITETNLLSVTIPGNTLGNNRAFQANLFIDSFQNSSSTVTTTLRMYYGGVLQNTLQLPFPGSNTAVLSGNVLGDVLANNSVSSQISNLVFKGSGPGGTLTALSAFNSFTTSSASVDSTTDQPFTITVQQSRNAGGAQKIRMEYGIVNLLTSSATGNVSVSSTNVFAGQNYFTSSTYFTGNPYFIPCSYWATSTNAGSFGTICLDEFGGILTQNLAINGTFSSWVTSNTPASFGTSSFFGGDPSDASGGGEIIQKTSGCLTNPECAQMTVTDPTSSGAIENTNPYVVALSQPFTYDPAKTYDFSINSQELNPGDGGPGGGPLNVAGITFSTQPISLAVLTDPTIEFWNVDGTGWATGTDGNFTCFFLASDTSWHAYSSATGFNQGNNTRGCALPTGSNGTTTVYANIMLFGFPTSTDPSTDTFNMDNFQYGVANLATTTPGFNFTTPTSSLPFNFLGGAAAHFSSLSLVSEPMTSITTTLNGTPAGDLLPGGNLLWDAYKMAFVAGGVSSDTPFYGQEANRGIGSVNFGLANGAHGIGSVVGGGQNSAYGDYSFCVGNDNHCNGLYSNAFGIQLTNDGTGSSAFGFNNLVSGTAAAVFGSKSYSTGDESIAAGLEVTTTGKVSFGFGQGLTVAGNNSFGINLDSGSPQTISGNNIFAVTGGNVGIGTTTPGAALTVDTSYPVTSGAPAAVFMDGNVGVGTTTPTALLDVEAPMADSPSQEHFGSNLGAGGGYLTSDGVDNFFLSGGCHWTGVNWLADAPGCMNIGGGAGGAVTPEGSITLYDVAGLTPSSTIDIEKYKQFESDANGNIYMGFTPGAATITSTPSFFRSGSNGNIGINTTTPQSPLTVVGDTTITGGNSTGQCTLNGLTLAQCTHTVPAGSLCVANEDTTSAPSTLGTSVSGTTLTITSALTLDTDVVTYHCF